MSFSDTPGIVCDELARTLETIPSVVAADYLPAAESPSGRDELDVVVQATGRNTLPNAVTNAIVLSSLGIVDVTDANALNHKRVVVR